MIGDTERSVWTVTDSTGQLGPFAWLSLIFGVSGALLIAIFVTLLPYIFAIFMLALLVLALPPRLARALRLRAKLPRPTTPILPAIDYDRIRKDWKKLNVNIDVDLDS